MSYATARRIAELNDSFRQSHSTQMTITAGIHAMPVDDQIAIIGKVQEFNDFTKDNNPYGERDFGAFSYAGQRIFWKIDYYNAGMTGGSEDPSDPQQTTRVLTIMLAHEY